MTIYRIYINNANNAGFWIQHRSWQNMCALVLEINGRVNGRLPGSSPSHDHAAVNVQYFDVRSGRAISVKPAIDSPEDRGYSMIAQPPWYKKPAGAPGAAATLQPAAG